MPQVLINGLTVQGQRYALHIDLWFPRGVENCYIDPEDFDSMEAWLCLAHDWGFPNVSWWIRKHNFRPSPLLRTETLGEGAAEIYEHYDDIFSIAVYGRVKGYESGSKAL